MVCSCLLHLSLKESLIGSKSVHVVGYMLFVVMISSDNCPSMIWFLTFLKKGIILPPICMFKPIITNRVIVNGYVDKNHFVV